MYAPRPVMFPTYGAECSNASESEMPCLQCGGSMWESGKMRCGIDPEMRKKMPAVQSPALKVTIGNVAYKCLRA